MRRAFTRPTRTPAVRRARTGRGLRLARAPGRGYGFPAHAIDRHGGGGGCDGPGARARSSPRSPAAPSRQSWPPSTAPGRGSRARRVAPPRARSPRAGQHPRRCPVHADLEAAFAADLDEAASAGTAEPRGCSASCSAPARSQPPAPRRRGLPATPAAGRVLLQLAACARLCRARGSPLPPATVRTCSSRAETFAARVNRPPGRAPPVSPRRRAPNRSSARRPGGSPQARRAGCRGRSAGGLRARPRAGAVGLESRGRGRARRDVGRRPPQRVADRLPSPGRRRPACAEASQGGPRAVGFDGHRGDEPEARGAASSARTCSRAGRGDSARRARTARPRARASSPTEFMQ